MRRFVRMVALTAVLLAGLGVLAEISTRPEALAPTIEAGPAFMTPPLKEGQVAVSVIWPIRVGNGAVAAAETMIPFDPADIPRRGREIQNPETRRLYFAAKAAQRALLGGSPESAEQAARRTLRDFVARADAGVRAGRPNEILVKAASLIKDGEDKIIQDFVQGFSEELASSSSSGPIMDDGGDCPYGDPDCFGCWSKIPDGAPQYCQFACVDCRP